jgi:hypothetical protein
MEHRLSFFQLKARLQLSFIPQIFCCTHLKLLNILGWTKKILKSTHSRTPAENRSLQLQLNSVATVMDRAINASRRSS